MRKPPWLRKKIRLSDCSGVSNMLRELNLHTVCQEALCPNIGECFEAGTATFLILGTVCTRSCEFCGVSKGEVLPLDPQEPARVAEAVKMLKLKHVVITSVTRDDLADGGAGVFGETIAQIRVASDQISIEVLIPDFQGNEQALRRVINARPQVVAHNLETVPRLYPEVRMGADYERSLDLLRSIKRQNAECFSKSGLMLGLGERQDEIERVMRDLRAAEVDFLTLGQYLAPSEAHVPVAEYIRPEQFQWYYDFGMGLGFSHVMSAPYVRSSYLAGRVELTRSDSLY